MSEDVKPTRRPYRSGRRAAQAAATRAAVVHAARRQFVAFGYAGTTVQSIADEADVAVQTIYASFGNKRQILADALDVAIAGDDRPLAVNDRDWMRIVFEDPDPRVRVRAYASAVRRIFAGAADMFLVLQAAVAVDAGLAELAATAEQRRRHGAASVVDGLVAMGALRADLSPASAVDVLWALNSPELFQLLVRKSRWSLAKYEAWLADTLVEQLIRVS